MRREDAATNGDAGLEKAGAHGHVLHGEHSGCLGRGTPFEVAEHEYFALPPWQRGGNGSNERDGRSEEHTSELQSLV